MTKQILGEGRLSWHRHERVTDRYGTVNLHIIDGLPPLDLQFQGRLIEGSKVKLVAKILGTRQSGHIGDVFNGFKAKTPAIGEEFTLGEGELFFEESSMAGVKPADGRETFWLDPSALYSCIDQDVELRCEII